MMGTRQWSRAALALLMAVTAGGFAFAADMDKGAAATPQSSTGTSATGSDTQRGSAAIVRAHDMIGADVQNARGEKLGDVRDVVLNVDQSRVAYVVLQYGGFMGMGDKYFAVPWSALQVQPQRDSKKVFVLDVDKRQLQSAPGFDKSNWPDMGDPQWGRDVHRFYNQEYNQSRGSDMGQSGDQAYASTNANVAKPWEPGYRGDLNVKQDYELQRYQQEQHEGLPPPDVTVTYERSRGFSSRGDLKVKQDAELRRYKEMYEVRPGDVDRGQGAYSRSDRDMDTSRDQGYARDQQRYDRDSSRNLSSSYDRDQDRNMGYDRDRDQNAMRDQSYSRDQSNTRDQAYSRDQGSDMRRSRDQAFADRRQTFWARRASDLIGLNVRNRQGDSVGEIEDLAIDSRSGQVAYAILSLDLRDSKDKLAVVPWSALQVQPRQRVARIEADEQTLRSVSFAENQLPNLSDRSFAQRISSQFGVEPYWTTYGYVGSEGRQAQPVTGWDANSEYMRKFNASSMTTIQGAIESVGTFTPQSGASEGLRLRVKATDGKTYTVQAGPRAYTMGQGGELRPNDQVTVKGSQIQMDGRDVIMASEITVGDRTIRLRDEQGRPLWSTQMGTMKDRSGSMQQP